MLTRSGPLKLSVRTSYVMAASGRKTGRIEASRLYASTARWMQRMAV